ncbi:MAG: nucleotidyl transferase AbiEii/AbiGii toxin family protein [Patulibacter sp.]|nr:nucleotidyl transferase AbiEii/AbiGii toxin family protein [Patulibacter sp.]
MTPQPKRPPGNLPHLQRLANAAATAQSIPLRRYQRWINVQILSAALERVRDQDGEPLFALKGGAAMELRLGLTARASADYDATFRAQVSEMLNRIDEALRNDWNGFTLQRSEAARIATTHTQRMDIKFFYRGRPWGTIQLEVGPSEGASGQEIDRVPARPLDAVQLDTPDKVACVSIRYQIAQKIHACTEVFTGRRGNERFRDLIDIELLRELIAADALPAVRDACVEIFQLRQKHQWPPTLTVGDTWSDGFRAMAREIAFDTDDVEISATRFRAFVNEIDQA